MPGLHPRAEQLQMLLLKEEFSVTQLIQAGTLDSSVGAFLWAMMARRASVIVAAGPRLIGKSTMLHALTSFLPKDSQFVTAIGQHETFDFAKTADASKSYILVSEISDHTPHYVAGPGVDRLFHLLESGYRMGATVHADSPEEVVQTIKQYSVDVPGPVIAKGIDLIVTLYAEETASGIKRRVRSVYYVWREPKAPQEVGVRSLVSWQADRDAFTLFHSPEAWLQMADHLRCDVANLKKEMESRKRFLEGLIARGVLDYGQVLEAIRRFNS
ncbi:MAG: hypothetical protein EXR50_05305 [Dehalococcoidia bacterium]|nr:hypothetical protein [Dehalococcoidia bacterium]